MAAETPAVGTFVPLFDPPRKGKGSARVGWIVCASGCHEWQGARSGGGYGLVRIDGRSCAVHRLRYELEVGPIPEGMDLDHFVCDNGAGGCCNPLHCRPTAHRENMLRGATVVALNAAKTHCIRGHPLSGDNLLAANGSRAGLRVCRTCDRHRMRARCARNKALRARLRAASAQRAAS